MYYKNIKADMRIGYLFKYAPNRNTNFYKMSSDFVRDYKAGSKLAIDLVFDELYPYLENNFSIAVFPKADNSLINPGNELSRKIAEQAQKEGKSIVDCSKSLMLVWNREFGIRSIFKTPRFDDPDIRYELVVKKSKDIENRDILLIADIAKKGNLLEECKQKLLKAGAKTVTIFSVCVQKETERERDLKFNFIFDIDDTLFNNEKVKYYIQNEQWDIVADYINQNDDSDREIKKMIQAIDKVNGSEIYFITKAPRIYAEMVLEKLGLDTGNLLEYNEENRTESNSKPLWTIRKSCEDLRACNIVISDNEKNLIYAKDLASITVLANWNGSANTKSDYADFVFQKTYELIEKIEELTEEAMVVEKIINDF